MNKINNSDFIFNFLQFTILNFCNCKDECIIEGIDKTSILYKTIYKITDEISKKKECNILNTSFTYPFISRIGNKYKYLSISDDIKIKKNVRLWHLDFIINEFIKNGLLNKKDRGLYILNTFKRFTWGNIQSLNVNDINFDSDNFISLYINVMKYSNNVDDINTLEKEIKNNPTNKIKNFDKNQFLKLIKIIFWYFRKCCVDSIIVELISNINNIVGLSVGSTTLTSDYDITLYGRNKDLSLIIKNFKKIIKSNFYDISNIIFDTNIYGVSFIIIGDYSFISDDPIPSISNSVMLKDMIIPYSLKTSIYTLFKKMENPEIKIKKTKIINKYEDYISDNIICKSKNNTVKNFRYFINNNNTDIYITQHVWAFVKLLLRINIIKQFDEIMYSKLIDNLFNTLDHDYLYNADKIINIFNIKTPPNIIFSFRDFEQLLKKNGILDDQFIIHNYISFVQYHNNETYFSKGAFMDVVVNSQMCNNKIIKLSIHEYFDSFIENMSEFILHYQKYKYLDRAIKSFNNLFELSDNNDKQFIRAQIDDLFNKLDENRKQCHDMITNKCIPFNMMEDALQCIFLSCKIYKMQNMTDTLSLNFLNKFDKLIQLSELE